MAADSAVETRLGDLVSIEHGWPFRSTSYSTELTGGPIVVAIGNFQYDGGFRFDSTTTKEYRGEYPSRYELDPGDMLLVMTCQTSGGEILGIPARVPNDGRTYLHNQRIGKVAVRDDAQVDRDYLYWLFLSGAFNRHLFVTATGSKILHTAPSRIEDFVFDLPPLAEQRRIAHILGTLDDKIELNRRMNATLEEMARALFKSWFVDFHPVRAKAEGRDTGLPKHLTDIFPDRLVDSELGEIPEGWTATTLGEIVQEHRDGVNPLETPEDLFDHFSIPAFDSGRTPTRELGSAIRSLKYTVPTGAVLLSKLNPETGRVWAPDLDEQVRSACSTEFVVLTPKPPVGRVWLTLHLASDATRELLTGLVTGTSKSHQRVQKPALMALPVALPAEGVLRALDSQAEALLARSRSSLQESASMTALRDALLKELIH